MTIRFDKYEKRGPYHWDWYETNQDDYRDNVDRVCAELPNNGTVLDIGCGDGLLTYKMFEQGLNVVGIDNNRVGIRQAQQMSRKAVLGDSRLGRYMADIKALFKNYPSELAERLYSDQLNFFTKSVYDLPLTATYDYVICHEVIEHVPDAKAVLDIMYQITNQYAIISTPDGNHTQKRQYDFHIWTKAEFEELLSSSNWSFEYFYQNEVDMYLKLYKN